jgi:hypothetical protein
MADPTDIVAVNRAEFAANMVPCLDLVAPVGMTTEDRRTWLNAAFLALDGIPVALLKRGCEAAMRRADHPAKIVAIIHAEVEQAWRWRAEQHARRKPLSITAPIETAEQKRDRLEVAALVGDLRRKLEAKHG